MKRGKKNSIYIVALLLVVAILQVSTQYTGRASASADESLVSATISRILELFSFKDNSLKQEPFIFEGADSVCGNNIVELGEQCDPPGSVCLITPDPNVCNSQCLCVQVPIPTITSINPSSVEPNTPFILEIIGTNFLTNPPAGVLIDGMPYTASSQTTTRITLSHQGLNDGTHSIQIINGNQILSNAVQLTAAVTPSQRLVLENARVRFTFVKTANNIYPEQFQDLESRVTINFDSSPAWKIQLKDFSIKPGTKTIIEPTDFQSTFNAQVSGTTDKVLTAVWDDIQIDAGNKFDVTLIFTLTQDEKIGRWKLDVAPHPSNGQRYSVFYTESPVLSIRKLTDDALLLPLYGGVLVTDPIRPGPPAPPAPTLFELHERGFDGYPGRFAIQMLAYLSMTPGNQGLLYLGADDSAGYVKKFPISKELRRGTDENLVLSIQHFSENNNVPNTDVRQPYSVLLGVMRGDWYDAASYYRSWALNQPWLARGKLESTLEVSPAFKDSHFVAIHGFNPPLEGQPVPPININLADELELWKNALGIDRALAHWWSWHEGVGGVPSYDAFAMPDVRPRQGVSAIVQQAVANNNLVAPYYLPTSISVDAPFYTTHNMVQALLRDDENNYLNIPFPRWPYQIGEINFDASVTPRSLPQLYQQIILPPLIAAGFNSIYLDVLTVGAPVTYYVPGRPSGDPRAHVRGLNNFLSEIRQTLRTGTNNNFYVSSELTTEPYISNIDLMYHDIFLAAAVSPYKSYIVPLWETIYHDYSTTSYFQAASALDFTFTILNGALVHAGIVYNYPDPIVRQLIQRLYIDYTKKYLYLRDREGKKFLAFGQRLRDPQFVTSTVDRSPAFLVPYTATIPAVPVVIPVVWKASDGSLGIVLANWGGSFAVLPPPQTTPPTSIDVTIDFAIYGLVPGESYALYELTESGRRFVNTYSNTFTLDVDVPVLTMMMFALEPVTPGCGNGILEPGEQCEVNIPCTTGSCDISCRCIVPSPHSGGGGGSGGRSGGGSGSLGFVTYLNFDKDKSYIATVSKGSTFFAKYNDNQYSIRVERLESFPIPKVHIKILPRYQSISLGGGEKNNIHFDNDNIEDIEVRAVEINKNMKAILTFNRLTEFSNRYLWPRSELPEADIPRVQPQSTTPIQELPTISEAEEVDQKFIILTNVLAGSIILFIFSIVFYLAVRQKKA